MCLRRSKKVDDISVVDFREIQRKSIKPSLFALGCAMIKYSVKRFFQTFQKAGHSTRVDPLSAAQNRALQRIILAAGLMVFLIALVCAYFNA